MINKQKGVSLIITFFIMVILLAIVLFISVILYSQVKLIRNIGDSMVSFFAADSGIEKVLYYDRQVRPTIEDGSEDGILVGRGLCAMFDSNINPDACVEGSSSNSTFCNEHSSGTFAPEENMYRNPDGCDPKICDDCQISFETTFNNRTYKTTAAVYPSSDGQFSIFQIESKGAYGGSERQVKVSVSLPEPGAAIQITNACADPISTYPREEGEGGILISANVVASISGDFIDPDRVVATIHTHNLSGEDVPVSVLPLSVISGDTKSGIWRGTWITTNADVESYYVDLKIQDTVLDENGQPINTRNCKDIWSTTFCRKNNPEHPSCRS